MIYFISDCHFGHKNVLEYDKRPFSSIDEHDEYIIKQWNNTVNTNDIVMYLGDFGFKNSTYLKGILNRLNGHKILVMGNHDIKYKPSKWQKLGFIEVFNSPYEFDRYILSHEPLQILKDNQINIHGHMHGKKISSHGDYSYIFDNSEKYIEVSANVLDYKPISFDTIERISKNVFTTKET